MDVDKNKKNITPRDFSTKAHYMNNNARMKESRIPNQ